MIRSGAATVTDYTKEEDMSNADLVMKSLGDASSSDLTGLQDLLTYFQ